MNAAFDRIAEATGARTQAELAAILGIRQSSISDAKRRKSIPDAWLIKLIRSFSLNPDWILTGHGSKFITPSATGLHCDTVREGFASTVATDLPPMLLKIAAAVATAREKHPRFAEGFDDAYLTVLSESLEWQSQAMLVPRRNGRVDPRRLARAEEESMHCIATHIRFLLREYFPQ